MIVGVLFDVVILSAFPDIKSRKRLCWLVWLVWLVSSEGQGMSMCWFRRNDWLVKSTERTIDRQWQQPHRGAYGNERGLESRWGIKPEQRRPAVD